MALSNADTALGRLAGVGRLLRDPHLLVRPYVTREALANSRIEGTQASLSDVFRAVASGGSAPGSDVREVENYIRAMETGLELVERLPISSRVLRTIHETLLQDVRGRERPRYGTGSASRTTAKDANAGEMRTAPLPVRDHPPVPGRERTAGPAPDRLLSHAAGPSPGTTALSQLLLWRTIGPSTTNGFRRCGSGVSCRSGSSSS